MKSEDQLLLEEAYQDVLLNELNWKGSKRISWKSE